MISKNKDIIVRNALVLAGLRASQSPNKTQTSMPIDIIHIWVCDACVYGKFEQ